MSHVAATSAAHHAAAIAEAIKASGSIVQLEPAEFMKILDKIEKPLVVVSTKNGFFGGVRMQYLASHCGLAFYTKSKEPLRLPGAAEIISAKKIWVPEMGF